MTLRADFLGFFFFCVRFVAMEQRSCAVPLQAAFNELFPVISAWEFANSCVLREILLAAPHGQGSRGERGLGAG